MTPRYKHNACPGCSSLLGTWEEYDLYFCSQGGQPTVIARYGDGGDYNSGLVFSNSPELKEAKRLARERGLI